MTLRIPNTSSPVEVRQAIQRINADAAGRDSSLSGIHDDIEAIQGDLVDVNERLDEIPPSRYTGEAVEDVVAGAPVYRLSGLTSVGVARADTPAKGRVCGVACEAAATGYAVEYAVAGSLVLEDWSAAVGTTLLTPAATYYLAPTGGLTVAAPNIAGQVVMEVGQAVDSRTLQLSIRTPILL